MSGRDTVIGEQRPKDVLTGVEAKFQEGLVDRSKSWRGELMDKCRGYQ